MRYAFLHKNFRELNFERRVIFVCHVLTMLFCFFPWHEGAIDSYSGSANINAFGVPGLLIGMLIFLISLVIFIYFLDRLFESERVTLPISENTLFFGASLQQILLIVIAWTVLASVGRSYLESEVRFGIFLVLITQVTALVATFLNSQLSRQQQARAFFNHPGTTEEHAE